MSINKNEKTIIIKLRILEFKELPLYTVVKD